MITSPSIGIVSPERTRIRSPARTSAAGTVRVVPSGSIRSAVWGAISSNLRIARRARSRLSDSSDSDSPKRKATVAASSH